LKRRILGGSNLVWGIIVVGVDDVVVEVGLDDVVMELERQVQHIPAVLLVNFVHGGRVLYHANGLSRARLEQNIFILGKEILLQLRPSEQKFLLQTIVVLKKI
jgi:hypothetical protein